MNKTEFAQALLQIAKVRVEELEQDRRLKQSFNDLHPCFYLIEGTLELNKLIVECIDEVH